MSEKDTGLLTGANVKFYVERMDGSSAPGKKHERCFNFVLDIDHDPHALPALKAYAQSCRKDYPQLADDLDAIFNRIQRMPLPEPPRPEPEPRKTCGGCAYYEPHEREERGGCTVPIPFWALPTKWVSVDATDCPCYVPKGE